MTRCFRSRTGHAALGMATGIWMLLGGASIPAAHASDCTPPSPTAASYAANGCDATLSGGTFDTGSSLYASVLHAVNGGSITVTGPVTLHSGGDNSTGAYANDGGLIRLDAPGSILTMLGAHSNGVHAFGNSAITGQVNMTTSGTRAHAAFADYGGVIQLHDSIITTHGAEAAGRQRSGRHVRNGRPRRGWPLRIRALQAARGRHHRW